MDFRSLPLPMQIMQLRQMQEQQQARRQAGQVLYDQFGQQQPAVPPPPPQQQAAPAPGAMSPGGGNPAVMGGQPQPRGPFGPSIQPGMMPPPPQGGMPVGGAPGGMPARPMQPPPIPPFKPMPSAPASNDAAGAGSVPPPPTDAAPGTTEQPGQRPFNLRSIVQGLKSSGVAPAKVMDMLDALSPAMTAENKAELDAFKTHNAALAAANRAYAAIIAAGASAKRADTGATAEVRRTDQGNQNIQIKRDRESRLRQQAEKTVGGKLTKIEYLYPNGLDGKPDTAQPPTGARGVTSQGKIVNLDAQGQQVAQQPGQPAQKGGGQKDAVRTSIVKSGITNSIARLNEIDKLGDVSTSSFFGQHGSNPLTRGAYGAAKGMQSKGQQDADAKWASMIDEAIPVFTGGLRGSDAFRRFLIEQAPGPGDKPETIKEKKRLFRQNIEGTSKAFFNKFSTDPSFWGPGVKKEEIGAEGGSGAPQQGGGEWKVEKVN